MTDVFMTLDFADERPNEGAGSGPRYADPNPSRTVKSAAPEGCRRSAPSRKVERSAASNTLRRGRTKALAPPGRPPAQVLS